MPCIQKWAGDVLGGVCETRLRWRHSAGLAQRTQEASVPSWTSLPRGPGLRGAPSARRALQLGREGAPWPCGGPSSACDPRPVPPPWACRGVRGAPSTWLAVSCGVEGTPRSRSRVTFHFQYRSINHRMDAGSMWLYRWYYSDTCQW